MAIFIAEDDQVDFVGSLTPGQYTRYTIPNVPAGATAVMVAFVAVDGPLLRTWILDPPCVPRLIVPDSAALLTESTALGEAPAAAVD